VLGYREEDVLNRIVTRHKPLSEEKGGSLRGTLKNPGSNVSKKVSVTIQPVDSIRYRWVDKYGTSVGDEVVNLSDPCCPFAEKCENMTFIKQCRLQPQSAQINGKVVHGHVRCYPRGYINHYKECLVYQGEIK